MKIREHLKLHAVFDVDTRIFVAASVSRFRLHNSPVLISLLENVYEIKEVYADKGYAPRKNIEYVIKSGAERFIAVRNNAS